MINNSCVPNAHHNTDGLSLIIQSYERIAKGQEIFISYTPLCQTLIERHKTLSYTYNFNCQCAKCQIAFEDPEEMPRGDPAQDSAVIFITETLRKMPDLMQHGLDINEVESSIRSLCTNANMFKKTWQITMPPLPNIYELLAYMLDAVHHRYKDSLTIWLKLVYAIDPVRFPNKIMYERVENLF